MSAYLHTDLDDTICALATPEGIGAIGIIRISGKEAITIANKIFEQTNLENVSSHSVHLGKIMDGGKIIDEVLATVFISPRSYTGENSVELSCHGSSFIFHQILELLIKNGARLAKPGEFTLRAFLSKKLDLTQAEAVADLIASNSEESHKTAIRQIRGGFSELINSVKEKLVNFASLIELELDFSEEDVEFAKRDELKILVNNIQLLVSSLIQSFKYGNAIKNGIPTVIAGKPNSGKSTLLNSLLNEDRAIVSEIEGTTRDTIEEILVIGGIVFRLIDTAGIRTHTSDLIEEKGIARTLEKIKNASILIYLFDASSISKEQIEKELSPFKEFDGTIIVVANKIDLLKNDSLNSFDFNSYPFLKISSLQKSGIEELKNKLLQTIQKEKINSEIVITNFRHYESLKNTSDALQNVLIAIDEKISSEILATDIRRAIFHLSEITGEITTEDLLSNIFSKFCIGK